MCATNEASPRPARTVGLSYLRHDAPASSAVAAGHVRVCDSRVSVQAVVRRATALLSRAACSDDIDEIIQTQLIRAWMSGRGLPEDVETATRALVWRARRDILSQRWLTRQLRTVRFVERPFALAGDGPEWGVAHRLEWSIDARTAVDAASKCVGGKRRGGVDRDLRATVALEILAGETSASDAAREHGATQQAWSRAARTLAERLRVELADDVR